MSEASQHPTHGWTHLGQAVHARTKDHLPTQNAYGRFNKRLAIFVTEKVGTMTCAYVFSLIAFCPCRPFCRDSTCSPTCSRAGWSKPA